MIEGLSHITLVVSDLDRSEHLLTSILDAQKVHHGDTGLQKSTNERFYLVAGIWLALIKGYTGSTRTYDHIAFKIDPTDFDMFQNRVEELGVDILNDRVRTKGEGRSIYFYDYDNHLFELHTGTLKNRLKALAR